MLLLLPPGYPHHDSALPDRLEHGYGLRVGEARRRVAVHGEDLVTWQGEETNIGLKDS